MMRVLLLLLFMVIPVLADPAENAWEAWLSGDFKQVEVIVRQVQADPEVADSTRAIIFVALGCADAMRGREASATTAFEQALTLSPSLRYSAADLPPPVWKLYLPVQQRFESKSDQNRQEFKTQPQIIETTVIDTVVKYIPVSRTQGQIARSLLYPGWGHLTEGRRRGWVLGGVETLLLGGAIWSYFSLDQARTDYLGETDQKAFDSAYARYNQKYQLTWGLATAALATYIFAQWDFFSQPPQLNLNLSSPGSKSASLKVSLTL